MKRTKSKLFVTFICAVLCCAMLAALSFTGVQKRAYADFEENENIQLLSEPIKQTGFGHGINVITAGSYNDYKYEIDIFNDLNDFVVYREDLLDSNSTVYSSTDIKDFAMRYNFDLGIGAEVSTLIGAIKGNLSQGVNFKFSDYKYKYYYTSEHQIDKYRLYIKNSGVGSTFYDKLSDVFLSDVIALNSGNMNVETFFERYGTHIVISAIFGGRLNAYNVIASNKLNLNAENKVKLDGAIELKGTNPVLKARIASALSVAGGISYDVNDFEMHFNVVSNGGKLMTYANLDEFDQKRIEWENSFGNDDAVKLVDYTKNGLKPIWDIIPEEYPNARTVLKNVFIEKYTDASSKFLDEFKTSIYVDGGDYVNFSGGTGTALDPYLITKPEQMLNIENNMNACYKLKNDISLAAYSDWQSIGGYYKEKAFNGVFDGDGHTISDLTRKTGITPKNNRCYFGLFGYVGPNGVIKNLKFTNINASMNTPSNGNGNWRMFYAVVAGSLHGKVSNVQILSGSFWYSKCVAGFSYVGSISGVANNATIENCTNNISLTSGHYSAAVGGISAYATGSTIKNCVNTGNLHAYVTGVGGWALVGGIVGQLNSGATYVIENCSNSGTPSASKYGGGLNWHKYTGQETGRIENKYYD